MDAMMRNTLSLRNQLVPEFPIADRERAFVDLGQGDGPRSRVPGKAIPKLIHYVWFGGRPLPPHMQEVIAEWQRLMPDHAIVGWNESNLDVSAHPWMARMHADGRFAFASDYARFQVLHEHGGIYLDTDVRMKKSLAPFLGEECLWSFEFDSFLSTCMIATVPKHPTIGELLAEYDRITGPVVNNDIVTRYFLRKFPEFRLNNKDQRLANGIRVVPKEYFIVPSFDATKNYAVHAANNQWKPERRGLRLGTVVRRLIGEVLFFKLVNLRMNWRSEYKALDRARRKH